MLFKNYDSLCRQKMIIQHGHCRAKKFLGAFNQLLFLEY